MSTQNPGHLGAAISRVLARRGNVPQYAFAHKIGVHHASLGRIIAGARPDRNTMKRMCQVVTHREDAIEIAIGHVEDELQACGILKREYVLQASHLAQTAPDEVDYAADELVRVARLRAAMGIMDISRLLIELAKVGGALIETSAPDVMMPADKHQPPGYAKAAESTVSYRVRGSTSPRKKRNPPNKETSQE